MARVVQPATCPACDLEFLPNRSRPRGVATQVYCSLKCSGGPRSARQPLGFRQYKVPGGTSAYRPIVAAPRTCAQCGESYIPKRRQNGERGLRFCSRACKDKARSGTARPRVCESCGCTFTPRASAGPYAAPRGCSKACRQRLRRAGIGGPRRAVKLGIAERDGWTCMICLLPVDRELRFPVPDSASVDHIVLVANGGGNDAGNLRLTHLGCNMRRGGWTS